MALAGGSLGIEPTTIHGQFITIIYKVDDTIPLVGVNAVVLPTTHHPPSLICYYLAGTKKSQNKNFGDHITTI